MQDRTVIILSVVLAAIGSLAFYVVATAAPGVPVIEKPLPLAPPTATIVAEARIATYHDGASCDLRYSRRDETARLTIYQSKGDQRLILAQARGLAKASTWQPANTGVNVEFSQALPCQHSRVVGNAGSVVVIVFFGYMP